MATETQEQLTQEQEQQPGHMVPATSEWPSLHEVGQQYVRDVLEHTRGNKAHAARILRIDRRSVYRWINGRSNGGRTTLQLEMGTRGLSFSKIMGQLSPHLSVRVKEIIATELRRILGSLPVDEHPAAPADTNQ